VAGERTDVSNLDAQPSERGRPAWPGNALTALGQRWAPRVLWELDGGALGFNELRARCDAMSTSVLAKRLQELAEVGLVILDDFDAWELTPQGEQLVAGLRTGLAE